MNYFSRSEIELIKAEFMKEIAIYEVEYYSFGDNQEAVILDDSLVLLMTIEDRKATACGDFYGNTYYSLTIEELTYNQLGFKHNHTKFIREMCDLLGVNHINYRLPGAEGSSVAYYTFTGIKRWTVDGEFKYPDCLKEEYAPLKIIERNEQWDGILYYFIIFEFEKKDGDIFRAAAYTTSNPQRYVVHWGNQFIKRGMLSNEIRMNWNDFGNLKKTWVGTKRQEILEKHMQYFVIEKSFREKDEVWRYADQLLSKANNGELDAVVRESYLRPTYKWIAEEQVLNITKKLYKEDVVISQYKPFFLKSPFGGQMSYDIYIQNLNVAIEYQGEQHFHPVDYFGGEESFEKQKIRDEEKMRLSKEHGIKLVYINYDEVISKELIREKVESAVGGDGGARKVVKVRVKQKGNNSTT